MVRRATLAFALGLAGHEVAAADLVISATLRLISVSARALPANLCGDTRHAASLRGSVRDYAHKFEIIDSIRLADRRSGALGDQDIQAGP
jgi:hypothetical protein